MFRIVFFVEDKNLPKVLHAVQGLVLNMEPPQPVVNAKVEKGKVKALSEGGSSMASRVATQVRAAGKGTAVNSEWLKSAIVKAGGQATSFSYLLKILKDQKIVKATKVKGEYVITANGEEK